ncbi:hypothetical protein REPUB_Repub08aG0026500 [Reevesia pubescens]
MHLLKPKQRNSLYVDAVMIVPTRAMTPVSGIKIAFDMEVIGPALFSALRLVVKSKFMWETMKDIYSGICVKSMRLPRKATKVEDYVVEVANDVKQQLRYTDPVFDCAAKTMLDWVKL